ncbi:MAG: C40 family peptidase [Peptostreptococcaceae bacterium]
MIIDNNYTSYDAISAISNTNSSTNTFNLLMNTLDKLADCGSTCQTNNTDINIGTVSLDQLNNTVSLDDISFNFGNRNINIGNITISNSNNVVDNTIIDTNNNVTTDNIVDTTSQKVQELLDLAHEQLGKTYTWGGNGPSTFDCSGLAKYLYSQVFDIDLPRVSYDQAIFGEQINKEDLQPGDLLFFDTKNAGRVSHVGIYTGNDEFIHAANSSSGVIKSSLSGYYETKYINATRPY